LWRIVANDATSEALFSARMPEEPARLLLPATAMLAKAYGGNTKFHLEVQPLVLVGRLMASFDYVFSLPLRCFQMPFWPFVIVSP